MYNTNNEWLRQIIIIFFFTSTELQSAKKRQRHLTHCGCFGFFLHTGIFGPDYLIFQF